MANNTRTIRGADEGPGGEQVPADSGYRDTDADNTGGISNRPFDEEVNNQQALPRRGQAQTEEETGADESGPTDRSDR